MFGEPSMRAYVETKTWATTGPLEFYDVQRVMRVAELTEKYQQGNSIGGPIDALQLNRNGVIQWHTRKQNCADN